jgi:dethiobiotin synthetase
VGYRIVITGTDTGIGKTVFSAGLARLLGASYWKPVQAGLAEETDTEVVRRLGGLREDQLLPERWRLRTPASPHLAAELDGVAILPDDLNPPATPAPLIIEGAGGVLVPLTRATLQIDVFARWAMPTVLCARTALGTINHTLLSIEGLRARRIPLLGIALIGDPHPENERAIRSFGDVRILGRLPHLKPLTPDSLARAFSAAFPVESFYASGAPK